MKLITLYLPETYINILDQLVEERFYPNRAEAIRMSVRDLIAEHGRFNPKTDYELEPHKKTAIERLDELQKKKL
ncbi:MAG: ribbon-helix-helix domain-containing protein, partial [Candidatus Bathyarchaeia archaeon]